VADAEDPELAYPLPLPLARAPDEGADFLAVGPLKDSLGDDIRYSRRCAFRFQAISLVRV
jgi:hypothetical protein